jgi:hypothetical protein
MTLLLVTHSRLYRIRHIVVQPAVMLQWKLEWRATVLVVPVVVVRMQLCERTARTVHLCLLLLLSIVAIVALDSSVWK